MPIINQSINGFTKIDIVKTLTQNFNTKKVRDLDLKVMYGVGDSAT